MQLNTITLLYPYLLLILPLFIICQKVCQESIKTVRFSNYKLLTKLTSKYSNIKKILLYLTIFLLSFALSTPVIKDKHRENHKDGYNISLLLDASDSMYEDNRFKIAKQILKEFISKRDNDAISLTVFGDYAFIASPFTTNKNGLYTILDYLKPGVAGDRATALYEAIYLSSNIFKKTKSKKRVAILLTDGINTINSVTLKDTISKVKQEHIKLYVISIGNSGDSNKNILSKLASSSGKLYTINNPNDLKSIYEEIDALERSKIEISSQLYLQYFYIYPLILAIIFMLIYTTLNKKDNLIVNLFILILIAISISQPKVYNKTSAKQKDSIAINIALDIGQSMEATDIYPSRVLFAKHKITNLISKLTNQKVSIFVFNKESYLVSPYSKNYENLIYQIEHIDPQQRDNKESNLLKLLKAIVKVNKNREKQNILLFTDISKLTSVEESIDFAKINNIRIYTYFIATNSGSPIVIDGNIVKNKLNTIELFKPNILDKKLLKSVGTIQNYSIKSSDINIILNNIKGDMGSSDSVERSSTTELYYIFTIIALSIIFYLNIGVKLWRR